jgi:hypothetical protein
MPEKKDKNKKPERVWPWPPPAKAECVPMPYYLIGIEPTPESEREGDNDKNYYTLWRVLNGEPAHVIGTTKYVDLLEAMLQDALVPMFAMTPRLMAEATGGEAHWKYNQARKGQPDDYRYIFAPQPPYFKGRSGALFPDFERRPDFRPSWEPQEEKATPEKPKAEATPVRSKPADTPTAQAPWGFCPNHKVAKKRNGCSDCRSEAKLEGRVGSSFDPTCPKHGQKHKSGIKDGRQSYKCAKCQQENALARSEAGAQPQAPSAGEKKPKCQTCKQPMYVHSRPFIKSLGRKVPRWRCHNSCAVTGQERPVRGPQLPETFELTVEMARTELKKIGKWLLPEDFDDALQELALDLWKQKIKPKDLKNRDLLRGYIRSQTNGSIDGHTTVGLNDPLPNDKDGSGKTTYADVQVAQAPSPHQQLEMKESIEAHLNGNGGAQDGEFVASVLGGAHEANSANGHHSQPHKFEQTPSESNLEEALMAKETEEGPSS